jgi:hypothetical protein
MSDVWGGSWGAGWNNAWGQGSIEPSIVIYGGDDAPRKKRKRRDIFKDVEHTIHQLLHPETEQAVVSAPSVATIPSIDEKLQDLLALAQGSHELLQRVARIRAEVDAAQVAHLKAREEDDEETLMWLL